MPASNPTVNPAVAAILDAHDQDAPAVTAPAGRPVKTRGRSMNPEAIRSRARREKAKLTPPEGVPLTRPDGSRHERNNPLTGPLETAADGPISPSPRLPDERFTAAHLQLMPDEPARPAAVTPDQVEKAIRNWSMIVRGAGYVASVIFKSDELKVPDEDARDCAEAILDGWPELAAASDADFKKIMAAVTVGSVAFDRWGRYQRAKVPALAPPVAAPVTPAGPVGKTATAAPRDSSLQLVTL